MEEPNKQQLAGEIFDLLIEDMDKMDTRQIDRLMRIRTKLSDPFYTYDMAREDFEAEKEELENNIQ